MHRGSEQGRGKYIDSVLGSELGSISELNGN